MIHRDIPLRSDVICIPESIIRCFLNPSLSWHRACFSPRRSSIYEYGPRCLLHDCKLNLPILLLVTPKFSSSKISLSFGTSCLFETSSLSETSSNHHFLAVEVASLIFCSNSLTTASCLYSLAQYRGVRP